MEELWSLDTGWANGGVFVQDTLIVEAPPIFRKFIGESIYKLAKIYKAEKCKWPQQT